MFGFTLVHGISPITTLTTAFLSLFGLSDHVQEVKRRMPATAPVSLYCPPADVSAVEVAFAVEEKIPKTFR